MDADGEQWPGSFDEVGSPIDGLLERLARCEADNPPGRNRRRGPSLGVAADARPLTADLPRAKRRTITGSPCRKLALMVVRMASTAASAWAVVHASSWAIRCTISAFLIVRASV